MKQAVGGPRNARAQQVGRLLHRWALPCAGGALGLVLALAGLPAAADWLVTTEGQRIETKGPWQVKGKLVVFSRSNGTLASVRLSEIDLDASRKATEDALKPPPPAAVENPAGAARKAALVLTDRDIKKHVGDEPPAAEEGEVPSPNGTNGVEVDSFNELTDPTTGEVQILGTLRNTSADIVTNVSVVVRLWGTDRQLLAETQPPLNPNTLTPGGTTNFRAVFAEASTYGTVTFEVNSTARGKVEPTQKGPAEPSEEGGDG